jgi:hypothetical protein
MVRIVSIALIGCLLGTTSAFAQGSSPASAPAPSLRQQIAMAVTSPAADAKKAPAVAAPEVRLGRITPAASATPKRADSIFKKPWFLVTVAAIIVVVVVVATSGDEPVSEGPDSPGRRPNHK